MGLALVSRSVGLCAIGMAGQCGRQAKSVLGLRLQFVSLFQPNLEMKAKFVDNQT